MAIKSVPSQRSTYVAAFVAEFDEFAAWIDLAKLDVTLGRRRGDEIRHTAVFRLVDLCSLTFAARTDR